MVWGCNLHVASRGNRFVADLAQLYAAALGDRGVATAVLVDEVPRGATGTVDVVVGPQEWFTVGPDLSDEERLAVAASCALLATEQPGSHWWDVQRPWLEAAGLVLDLSPVAVEAHRAEGLDALHAPVGYHPTLDAWGGEDDAPRDVDVTFLGGITERRQAALGPLGPILSHRSSRLLFHDPRIPVTGEGPGYVAGRDKAELLARTRVLVNVHRGGSDYFEWVRAVEALSNGALLLTEPSAGHQPLVPMAHFVAAEVGLLPAHVTALLADEVLRAKVAREAYDFVRAELAMADLLAVEVLPALAGLAAADRQPLGIQAPAPAPPAPRRSPPRMISPPESTEHRTLSTLKRIIINQIELDRRLDRMEVVRAGGHADQADRRSTPGWDALAEPPDVSVVIPLHDYEGTVVDAICSAFASRGVTVEVVVVDDRSTDRSRAVVEAFMDEHPEVPLLGIFRAVNAGPSVARNQGIAAARSHRCFLLDADNLVYPDALARLRDALDGSGAAFAYCILEVFGAAPGLVSALPWSVERLVQGPYIDAMSLLDKRAWEQVGGFREPDDALYGWEDYDFWLALAGAGLAGAWVPEPLARYRRHDASRTSITALDVVTPLNRLRRDHPDLPWPD